eukprot:TRINITY_DN28911_c0_g1_i1.p1 TRINITY_DN28911_c0_g1~~TRINITY_DN28911_c0_g1_i1.p1  ORF type:complete len:162 (-),score=25.14 TRINITY_DN28911_c0_g1_i1:403-888(-)
MGCGKSTARVTESRELILRLIDPRLPGGSRKLVARALQSVQAVRRRAERAARYSLDSTEMVFADAVLRDRDSLDEAGIETDAEVRLVRTTAWELKEQRRQEEQRRYPKCDYCGNCGEDVTGAKFCGRCGYHNRNIRSSRRRPHPHPNQQLRIPPVPTHTGR